MERKGKLRPKRSNCSIWWTTRDKDFAVLGTNDGPWAATTSWVEVVPNAGNTPLNIVRVSSLDLIGRAGKLLVSDFL